MIRVASLVSYPIMPAKMGGQKGIYLFLKYFCRYHPIVCYTTKNNEPGFNEPFRVKKVLGTYKLRYVNPFYFFQLKKEFKADQVTHLLLEQPYYGWLAILLKKALGIKLVIHSHNIEALRFKSTGKWWWNILGWYEKMIHRKADFNFFISQEDLEYALNKFRLDKEKCTVITYGTEKDKAPSPQEKMTAKGEICKRHNIDEQAVLLLYNGTLNYPPNKKGLDAILQKINPQLQQHPELNYKIIICGTRLEAKYNNLEDYAGKNIIYPGFVDDIDIYFQAADIFINPVSDGGGIKTKLVEALAAGCSAVSFTHGAIGVPVSVTGSILKVVADNDSNAFVENLINTMKTPDDKLPAAFFDHFYWDNIAQKAARHFSL
jgi:polysaccharide biosynthesis protein PslH